MRSAPYKVRFVTPYRSGGWIDGYTSAAVAKAEVARVNATTGRTKVSAIYLGDERRAQRAPEVA